MTAKKTPRSPSCTVGFFSAIAAAIFSFAYIVAQLLEWGGYLGSAGGPESSSTAPGLAFLLTPSLLLAPSFVIAVVCVHQVASVKRRIWSQVAITFATIYATLISFVYFVQLAFVLPRMLNNNVEDIGVFLFVPFDSFLYAVDILGYCYMSLSTLFMAFVFGGKATISKPERWLRRFLIANGLLIPFLAFQMYVPNLIYGGALWLVTFPTSMILLAIIFRRLEVDEFPESDTKEPAVSREAPESLPLRLRKYQTGR